MLVSHALREGSVPALLQLIATEALDADRVILRGDVIAPRGPLFAGSPMEALYATQPVYFDDEFALVEDQGEVVITWLVPISAAEASYVTDHGWSAFEHRLVEHDPDLTDVLRPSIPTI